MLIVNITNEPTHPQTCCIPILHATNVKRVIKKGARYITMLNIPAQLSPRGHLYVPCIQGQCKIPLLTKMWYWYTGLSLRSPPLVTSRYLSRIVVKIKTGIPTNQFSSFLIWLLRVLYCSNSLKSLGKLELLFYIPLSSPPSPMTFGSIWIHTIMNAHSILNASTLLYLITSELLLQFP